MKTFVVFLASELEFHSLVGPVVVVVE